MTLDKETREATGEVGDRRGALRHRGDDNQGLARELRVEVTTGAHRGDLRRWLPTGDAVGIPTAPDTAHDP